MIEQPVVKSQRVSQWIGELWIELQLTRQQLHDYQQALTEARQQLAELKGKEEGHADQLAGNGIHKN